MRNQTLLVFLTALACGLPLPSAAPPQLPRPEWLRSEGLVIAGSWESRAYRERASGDTERVAEILRAEQSEATALEIKRRGFNVALIPLYKGWGLQAERQGLEDAKRFTAICHRVGLRVGVYVFSGTINYETIQAEIPSALEWLVLRPDRTRLFYGNKYYRPWVNRSHPGVREHLRELVRYAIQEAHVDLLHFDNYAVGSGYEPSTLPQFRQYLLRRYTSAERRRRYGFENLDWIELPPPPSSERRMDRDPLYRDFVDFRCEALANTFTELSEYARKLDPGVLLCINSHGYSGVAPRDPLGLPAVDHSRLLGNTHMFWDEGYPSRMEAKRMVTRFRSHMLGRQFGASVLQYTGEPVSMAESLALGLQTLGCSGWFEGGKLRPASFSPEGTPLDNSTLGLIQLYRQNLELYRDTTEIADVAVLHSSEQNAFGTEEARARARDLELLMYRNKVPFTILSGRYPGDLKRFRAILLPEVELLPDRLVEELREYLAHGGRVLMVGECGKFDGNYQPRKEKLEALLGPGSEVVSGQERLLEALRRAVGGSFEVEVGGPNTLTMAAYRKKDGRRVIHLVNYDPAHPPRNVGVTLRGTGKPRVTWIAPEGRGPLAVRLTGSRATLHLKEIPLYAVLVVERP